MAYMGALHYWWPKITGRLYAESWARVAALIIFAGFNLTFFPQYLLGYNGMPRRYHTYPQEFQVMNILSSSGAAVLAIGYLLPIAYLAWSLWHGKQAGGNRAEVDPDLAALKLQSIHRRILVLPPLRSPSTRRKPVGQSSAFEFQ